MSGGPSYQLITPPSLNEDTDFDDTITISDDESLSSDPLKDTSFNSQSPSPVNGPLHISYSTCTFDSTIHAITEWLSSFTNHISSMPLTLVLCAVCLLLSAMLTVYLYFVPSGTELYYRLQDAGYHSFLQVKQMYIWTHQFIQGDLSYTHHSFHYHQRPPSFQQVFGTPYVNPSAAGDHGGFQPILHASTTLFPDIARHVTPLVTLGNLVTSMWFSNPPSGPQHDIRSTSLSPFASLLLTPAVFWLLYLMIIALLIIVCWNTLIIPPSKGQTAPHHSSVFNHSHTILGSILPHYVFCIIYQYYIYSHFVLLVWMYTIPILIVLRYWLYELHGASKGSRPSMNIPLIHPIYVSLVYIVYIMGSVLLSSDLLLRDPITVGVWWVLPISIVLYWGVHSWYAYCSLLSGTQQKIATLHLVTLASLLTVQLFIEWATHSLGMVSFHLMAALLWMLPSLLVDSGVCSKPLNVNVDDYSLVKTIDDDDVSDSGDDAEYDFNHHYPSASHDSQRSQLDHDNVAAVVSHSVILNIPFLLRVLPVVVLFFCALFFTLVSSRDHQAYHDNGSNEVSQHTGSSTQLSPFVISMINPLPDDTAVLQACMEQTKIEPTSDELLVHGGTSHILVSSSSTSKDMDIIYHYDEERSDDHGHESNHGGDPTVTASPEKPPITAIIPRQLLTHILDSLHADDIPSSHNNTAVSQPTGINGMVNVNSYYVACAVPSPASNTNKSPTLFNIDVVTIMSDNTQRGYIVLNHVDLELIHVCSQQLSSVIQERYDVDPSIFKALQFQRRELNTVTEYLLQFEFLYGGAIKPTLRLSSALTNLTKVGQLYVTGILVLFVVFVVSIYVWFLVKPKSYES